MAGLPRYPEIMDVIMKSKNENFPVPFLFHPGSIRDSKSGGKTL